MIPLYAFQAGGGKVYSLDDPTVAKDSAALNGTGGVVFTPFYTTMPYRSRAGFGFHKFRRLMQVLEHTTACTVKFTPIADDRESGLPVYRTLATGVVGIMNVPANEGGTAFSTKVEVTDYAAEVAFGGSEVFIVQKRRFR